MSTKIGSGVQYDSGYTIHVFTESGTFVPEFTGTVEVLVVAGGGGGGMDMGGGGGGGGVISNTAYSVTANSPITVTVGAGGRGGPAASSGITSTFGQPAGHQYSQSATNGGNSVFGTLTAIGGGYGGSSYFGYTPNNGYGNTGGSGGGASGYSDGNTGHGGAGTAGQGNAGGGSGGQYYSGGGGGAGGVGISGASVPHGGDGVLNAILGIPYYWGAGGGGAAYSAGSGGNGGKGGGGGGATGSGGLGGLGGINPGKPGTAGANNAQCNVPGGDAGEHTGSGGGGGSHYNANNQGGSGGSGIVIVRYLTSLATGTRGGISSSGLIFNIDVSNPMSYLPSSGSQASLIDTSSWTVSNGSIGIYSCNGLDAENQRKYDTDPWGNSNIIWETDPSGDGNADGGWNASYVTADRTKTYRFSVWVRRTSSTTGGTFYFGLHTNGTGDAYHLSDGVSQTNPYWDYRGTGWFAQNQWHLVVGHIMPAGWTGTTAHINSGIYTIANGVTKLAANAGNVPNDVRFPSDATSILSRVYHYYCADATTKLEFYAPRIDLCDGNEPSINQLLTVGGYNTIVDTVGGLKNNIMNAPAFTFRKGLTFSGSHYIDVPSNNIISGMQPFTIECWYNSTGSAGQELFGNYGSGYTTGYLWFFPGGLYLNGGSGISYFSDYGTRCFGRHHIVATRDAAGNCVTYLDGGASGIVSGTNAVSVVTGLNFRIGADVASAGEAFVGDVYALKVYNRVLSAAEVKQAFFANRGRYGM